MKHLLCVWLFLIVVIGNNSSNAQCINPTTFNGSLNFSSTTSSIPNDMAPTGWSKISTPDQARTGIPIDCATIPLVASPNGGTWTRMADKVTIQESIYRDISGFTAGTYYEVTFQQSLVKNWGRSSGHVNVTIGATTRGSANIALPSASVAQTSWQSVTVGPFLATASTMTLTLAAFSNQDGTGSSPMTGSCSGYTQNALAADLMIDGISVCPIASLPLSFLSFEITNQNSSPVLTWNVIDSDHELEKFVVTKSKDLITWNSIGELGNSIDGGTYSFPVQSNYSSSESYFKVTAYDQNNAPIATSIILSDKNESDKPCGWLYNKGSNELSISGSIQNLSVAVYDTKGNSLQQYFFTGNTIPVINATSLQEGLYIVHTNNGREGCSFRFVR